MYYNECTYAYRIAVIQDIIKYAQTEFDALNLIRQFMDGIMTVAEIEAVCVC